MLPELELLVVDVDDVDEVELEELPELELEEPPALELEDELVPLPGAVPAVQPCAARAADPNATTSALSAILLPVRCMTTPVSVSVAL